MAQLPLQLSQPQRFTRDNFIVSAPNREAAQWVQRWPDWPAHCLILHGPAHCGKTHLAHIWKEKSGADFLDAGALPQGKIIEKHAYILDGVEGVNNESALFHLFNSIREAGGFLLLTCHVPPAALPFKLPDLTSRLRACPAVVMYEPDDALLSLLMVKYFSDRQLKVEKGVVDYLAPRIERSFAAAHAIVESIDRKAMESHRNITVPLAREVLGVQG